MFFDRILNYIYFSQYFSSLTVLEVTDLEDEKEEKSAPSIASLSDLDAKEKNHFVTQLMEAFWALHSAKPANPCWPPCVCQAWPMLMPQWEPWWKLFMLSLSMTLTMLPYLPSCMLRCCSVLISRSASPVSRP